MSNVDKIEEARQLLAEAEKASLESERVKAAKAALEAAIKEKRDAEEAVKEAARVAKWKKRAGDYEKACRSLAADLNAAGIVTEVLPAKAVGRLYEWSYERLKMGNSIQLNLEEQTTGGTWHSYNTGKLVWVLRTGYERGDTRRFPQKADGSFNNDKIVNRIKEVCEIAAAKAKGEAEKKKLEHTTENLLVKPLQLEYGMDNDRWIKSKEERRYPKGRGYEYRKYLPAAGKVYVTVGNLELTPDQARVVLDALVKVGAIKKK